MKFSILGILVLTTVVAIGLGTKVGLLVIITLPAFLLLIGIPIISYCYTTKGRARQLAIAITPTFLACIAWSAFGAVLVVLLNELGTK